MIASVLIIDRDVGVVNAFRKMLGRHDFIVFEASSAEQALEAIRQNDPQVLILDVRVPGPPGIELLREVKALYPSLPIIVVTAYSTSFTEANAKREGVDGYFVKPFDISSLVEKLKTVARTYEGATANHQCWEYSGGRAFASTM